MDANEFIHDKMEEVLTYVRDWQDQHPGEELPPLLQLALHWVADSYSLSRHDEVRDEMEQTL
jgi:hypothetical protein